LNSVNCEMEEVIRRARSGRIKTRQFFRYLNDFWRPCWRIESVSDRIEGLFLLFFPSANSWVSYFPFRMSSSHQPVGAPPTSTRFEGQPVCVTHETFNRCAL
jgi:hypothetical protein